MIDGVRPYRPPPFAAPVELRLDANEGAVPDGGLLEWAAALAPCVLNRYPDARPLEAAIADRLGVSPARVLVTAGADDGLERAMRAVLGPGRDLVLPSPTFEMIERYARLTGARVHRVPWLEGPLPVEAMARCAGAVAVAVATPNSPTGLWADAKELERLSAACEGKLLMVDLAYTEFADEDLTAVAVRLPDAVAFRTMSKAWGLAGLRVGYAVGPPEVIGWMRTVGHPYAVSAVSLALASRCLETGEEGVRAFVESVRGERGRITELLTGLGARVWPSRANFVLARVPDARRARERLAGLGIAVRAFPDDPALGGCLRISLPGNDDDFDRLTAALGAVLGGAAKEGE
jgi:histidinol-phosphate aminotransferase